MPRKIPLAKKLENIPLGPRLKRLQPNPETMLDDLLAMAENRWTGRKGARRPREMVEKTLATKRLKKAAKKIEAIEAAQRRRKGARRRRFLPFGDRAVDKAMVVMVPGEWHTASAIGRAADVEHSVTRTMEEKGLVERGEVDKPEPSRGGGWLHPQKWVYRLTELGVATREAVMLVRVVLICALAMWAGVSEAQEKFHRVDGRTVQGNPQLLAQAERDLAVCEGERATAMLSGAGLTPISRQEAGWLVLRGCMARLGYVWR